MTDNDALMEGYRQLFRNIVTGSKIAKPKTPVPPDLITSVVAEWLHDIPMVASQIKQPNPNNPAGTAVAAVNAAIEILDATSLRVFGFAISPNFPLTPE